MLTKVQPFTSRPTITEANALVERINKAREELYRVASEKADDHDLCGVFDEVMEEVGLGDLAASREAWVTVAVKVRVTAEARRPDDSDFEEEAVSNLSDYLPVYRDDIVIEGATKVEPVEN